MNTIICILGRSGVGKDTLANVVCDELNLKKVVSRTTREPREREKDGVNYFFLRKEDYWSDVKEERICAHTKIGDNYYWTNEYDVLSSDIYIIDPQGLETLKEKMKSLGTRIVTIYITAPTGENLKRGFLRSPSGYDKFLIKAGAEGKQFADYEAKADYDYIIHNVHFEISKEQLKLIIQKEITNYAF